MIGQNKGGTGAIFQVSRYHLGQRKEINRNTGLSDQEKQFLRTLIESATLDQEIDEGELSDTFYTNRNNIARLMDAKGYASSRAILDRYKRNLTEKGILIETVYKKKGERQRGLFKLCDLTAIEIEPLQPRSWQDHRKARKKQAELQNQLIERGDLLPAGEIMPGDAARSERLWNGVLDSCMRTSSRDQRKLIDTRYNFGGEMIRVVTTSQTNNKIATIDDQRTIRAVITMVCSMNQLRKVSGLDLANEYIIDIAQLCNLCRMTPNGGNRETFRQSLNRLYATNFNITAPVGSRFATIFGAMDESGVVIDMNEVNHRFITELDSSDDMEQGAEVFRKTRYYRIALHSRTFERLCNPEVWSSFIDNPDILATGEGYIQLLYNWCNIHVGRSGNRVIDKTAKELWMAMCPSARYQNFSRDLLAAVKRFHVSNGGIWKKEESFQLVNLFGYMITVRFEPLVDYVLVVARDLKDPWIGNNSKHNRLLRQSQTAALPAGS